MFDYVNFECECPQCGEIVKDFQTKDSDCCLSTVEPWTVSEFHSMCDNCDRWISFRRKPSSPTDWLKDYEMSHE